MEMIAQERIDELHDLFWEETNDEYTQEWRDELTEEESDLICQRDNRYIAGLHNLCKAYEVAVAKK